MLGLYLLAAHLFGDFVLQSRWQADSKLVERRYRAEHVAGYSLPFLPILAWQGFEVGWARAAGAAVFLVVAHWLTDSRRFRSTLGDVVMWRLDARRDPLVVKQAWIDYVFENRGDGPRAADISDEAVRWPTPNPWSPIALMIDQTLHVCQLAVVGAILLS